MTKMTELALNGDQSNGIYFTFKGYSFHITKDVEMNSKFTSDLYHIWCECKGMPVHVKMVVWWKFP